jgi:phosphatidylserine/phosphatidylglycerophosphate/cardiolipin synthase-like enzyme
MDCKFMARACIWLAANLRFNSVSVVLLSMSTGKPHPLARQAEIRLPVKNARDFEIRVNGSLVGVLARNTLLAWRAASSAGSSLTVHRWRTGECVLVSICRHLVSLLAYSIALQADEIGPIASFIFLSDTHVLLAHLEGILVNNGALTVLDLGGSVD